MSGRGGSSEKRGPRDTGREPRLDEATLRALIEQIPLTVYIDRLDAVSSNVYTSPQLERILGYTLEEWVSDEELFTKVVHPDDRERVLAEHERTRETGEPFRMEYRMIARDGTVRWFLDEAAVIADETGKPQFHHGFLLDITERKELEEALRRSEHELRRQKEYVESLLRISPTAIVTLAVDGAVTSWNLAAEELFGYTESEAIGRDLDELIANRDDLRVEAAGFYEEFVRTGRFQAATQRTRKDGTTVDVELFAVAVTADGRPAGSLVVYHDVTASRAQQEAEKRYRELIEQLPLVTYIDEPTAAASSIYISPRVEELLGYGPDEWLADPELFPKLLHPDDRVRVLADHEHVFAAGETSWCFEYRLIARDGRTVWVRDEAVVVTDNDGTPRYVQGFLVDMTERREAEEALRESEERFRAMFEEAPIGVAWGALDATSLVVPTALRRSDGRTVYRRNRAYREMLGYSEEELNGLHFTEYTHPEDLPRELELYGDLVAGKIDRYELEKRYIHRDGHIVWARVVDSILRDEKGSPLFGLTMVEDITQRKEAEEALRKSEAELQRQMQYLQSLLEISPTAVVTLDLDERVTSWNPAAEKLFGYAQEEALGQRIEDLVLRTETLHEEGIAITQEALEQGSAQRLTRRMRRDETFVDVEVLVVPLVVDDERVGFYVIYHDVSDLHRQKQYYESLLEISPTAIITVDLADHVTSWNPAAEKLFGYTREEAIGANVDDLVAKSDEIRAEAIDVNRRGSEGEFEVISRRTRKDGTLVDVQVRVAPVVFEGELVGRYGIYHDISELQRQKQYFQSLLDNSPNAIAGIGLDNSVTAWNPAAEKLFGYTREEAIGANIDDLVAKSDEIRAEAVGVNRVAAEAGEVHLITRRTRKDGTLVDVEVLVAPVVVSGEMHGFYGIYHDISELQRQKQYFQSLLDNSPNAIAALDLDGYVTAWNSAAEKLFGYTREEALGRDLDDLVAASDEVRGEAADVKKQAVEAGKAHFVARRTRKDGSFVDVDVLVAPIVLGGERRGFYAIYHDIGELVRARREAEQATRAKSAFLATMSHEIRTPMNAVIGMTGLLLDTKLDPEQREFAEVVRTSGDALLTIIDDILDFSKIEAGKLELEHHPLDVRACLEAALDVVATRATEKGLDLAYLLDPAAPRAIVGDVTRLRQILINLLSNAVKFTEEGEVVVSLEARPGSAGRSELHFAVRDTGIGIAQERMDRLFESFSQLDASTTRRYGGTGLGLAISKRLAEMMGGAMWVESEAGKGSTFHFTIAAEEATALVPSHEKPTQPELTGKRLLIVDDNATNRALLARYADSWGMAAQATASPAEALAWVKRSEPFDVALLDLRMPEMDGIALAREIRRHRDAATLPLVLLTSLGRRREETQAGVDFAAYLAKPIKASQLYETLVNVLAERASVAPSAAAEPQATAAAQALGILLVEDNEVNQKLALALLAKLGYRADVAANGVEALAALQKRRYDVVLMDVEMPEMDGLEATRRIREQWPGAEGPRVVAMTAKAMQGDREACLAAGMDDYLSKPIRAEELADALRPGTPTAPTEEARAVADPDVVDPAALEQLAATVGDPAVVAELVGIFRRDAPGLLATLRSSSEGGNGEELRRSAHTLKSNARTFGATALAELCEELEARTRAGTLDGARDLVARIESEYARVADALQAVGAARTSG